MQADVSADSKTIQKHKRRQQQSGQCQHTHDAKPKWSNRFNGQKLNLREQEEKELFENSQNSLTFSDGSFNIEDQDDLSIP